MKDAQVTPRQRRLQMLSTGHGAEALNEAEMVIEAMREALESYARDGLTVEVQTKLCAALMAAAEGKGGAQ